jgi:hypothetical protein
LLNLCHKPERERREREREREGGREGGRERDRERGRGRECVRVRVACVKACLKLLHNLGVLGTPTHRLRITIRTSAWRGLSPERASERERERERERIFMTITN